VAKGIWALAFAKSILMPPVEEKKLYREDILVQLLRHYFKTCTLVFDSANVKNLAG
jgi:hypothetical protein